MTKAVAGHTLEQAELRVVRGTYKGLSCPLSAGTVFIGRSSECDLALKGAQGVSRRHCKVQYLGNRFVVIDLESRNGTIVNGQSVERKVLEKGDRIEVGDEIVEFHVESLDDLRSVQLQDGGIEDAVTAQMPQGRSTQQEARPEPSRPARPAPSAMDFDPPTQGLRVEKGPGRPEQTERVRRDVEPLPETLPPRSAMPGIPDDDLPPPLPPGTVPELSSPYVHQAKPAPSRAPLAFGVLTLAIVAGGAFLIWDLTRDDDVEPVDTVVMAPPAPPPATTTTTTTTTTPPPAPAPTTTTTTAPPAVDPTPPPAAVTPPPAGVVEPTPTPTPAPAPAPPPAIEPTPPPVAATSAPVFVRAKGGGRAQTIKVKVGDAVSPGTVLVVVSGDGGSLGRKLESLRREEKEFAAAALKDPAAKADLDYIRAEMKKIEAKLKPRDLVADVAGVVAEILVETGGVVRDGAPIVKLTP